MKSKNDKEFIQFNSTIPCGGYRHKLLHGECYYVIARYVEDREFGYLEDYTVVDGDFFNNDRKLAFSHRSSQETQFGSYCDGVIRYRKMYQFPTPHKTIPGVSFISKYNNSLDYNSSLFLDDELVREDSNGNRFTFYFYRHDLLS
ncbi:hypothetical protein [Bacillus atrophaeus]|uniref:hypothetical protein n=1 Tax=Bacillus atrophaeus TaxID=1452 RepID=UPI0038738465